MIVLAGALLLLLALISLTIFSSSYYIGRPPTRGIWPTSTPAKWRVCVRGFLSYYATRDGRTEARNRRLLLKEPNLPLSLSAGHNERDGVLSSAAPPRR